MNAFTRRLAALLALTGLVSVFFVGTALAQEGEEPAEEPAAEDAAPAAEPAAAEEALSEEQQDYVAIAGTVACYNKRVSDAAKATAAINGFLEAEGMTLDEYKAMEKKFRGDAKVQGAIKEEMSLCDTKVLAMPEEPEAEEALTAAEQKEIEEAETKMIWTYAKKVYKGTSSKGDIRNGRLVFAFQKNGKNAKGNFTGKFEGQSFALGLHGARAKEVLNMKGSSGKKNSATVKVTFKKKTIKNYKDSGQDYIHYAQGDGTFKGKINGKNVSFTFSVESKKK